jgi:uncharacterized protein YegL
VEHTPTDCDIVLIVDKSGSMSSTQSDVIGGFNTFIEKQKAEPGRAFVTLTLFDSEVTRRYTRLPIAEIVPLDRANYVPGGNTALFDAVGATLVSLEKAATSGKVVVVIMTDGAENASREYTLAALRAKIEQKQEDGWAFVFLGAGLDAFAQSAMLGVSSRTAGSYAPTPQGTRAMYDMLGDNVSAMRASAAPARTTAEAQSWDVDERPPGRSAP